MSVKIMKLDPSIVLTEEVHPEYGSSYSFPVSGVAGFKSTGINVEHNGKLYTMRFFNKKSEEVTPEGKPIYVPGVSLKEVKASVPKDVKVPKAAQAAVAAANAEIAALKAQMQTLLDAVKAQGSFVTAQVTKSK